MKRTVDRNLDLLFTGQFCSQIGDRFYALALAFWVLKATGSPARMGIVLFASMAPAILLGFVLGGVLDRWDRKRILIAADIVRGVAIVGITVIYYAGMLNLTAILIVQVILSAAAAFFNPTASAILPQIVAKDRLARSNALSQLLSGSANILGPILGGLAVAWCGYAFVFLVNAASFLLSAALAAGMRLPGAVAADRSASAGPALAAAYRFLWKDRRLLAILGIVAVIHFFVGSISVLLPVLAGALAGDGARNLGYLETGVGIGSVLCAAALHRVKLNGREVRVMFGGIGGIGAAMAATGALSLAGVASLPPYLMALPALSAAILAVATCYAALVQKAVEPAVAGGVFSILGSVGNLSIPLATLTFGFLLERTALGVVALGCGGAIALIGCMLFFVYSPLGRSQIKEENY